MKKIKIFTLLLFFTILDYGQSFDEANKLYKTYNFEEALNNLNTVNNITNKQLFLRLKILACLGEFDKIKELKNNFSSFKDENLKESVDNYFKQIDAYINPHENPTIEINGIKAKAYKHLASEGITPIDLMNKEGEPDVPYTPAFMNSSNELIYIASNPRLVGRTYLDPFTTGLAIINEGAGTHIGSNKKTLIINKKGEIIYECELCRAGSSTFNTDLLTIWKWKLMKIDGTTYQVSIPSIIDRNGKEIYDSKEPILPENYQGKVSIAGPLWIGPCMIPNKYYLCSRIKSHKLINEFQEVIVDFIQKGWEKNNFFDYNDDYAGFYSTINGVDKSGFIDKKGNLVFAKNDDFRIEDIISGFDNSGYVRYRNMNNDKDYLNSGYLDKKGNVAIQPIYRMNKRFYNEFAAVKINEPGKSKWAFIDVNGNMVSKAVYEEADSFDENGTARVQYKGKVYLLNKKFEPLILISKFEEEKVSDENLGFIFQSFWMRECKVENNILEYYGEARNSKNKYDIMAKFFNQKGKYLIAEIDGGDDSDYYCYQNEKINWLNFMIHESCIGVLLDFAEKKLNIDWNIYDVVDGQKFTVLDFIDCILNNEDDLELFYADDLERLKKALIENVGAKYGKQL